MKSSVEVMSVQDRPLSDAPWFDGSVEDAFASATQQKKDVFLYWGARWCPPCNQLKAEIFFHERFKDVVAPFVALALDGDEEGAQKWADEFDVSGYPTILVLDNRRRERLRLDASMTMAEFELALSGLRYHDLRFKEVLQQAGRGQASFADWQFLMRSSWQDSGDFSVKSEEGITLLGKAYQKLPDQDALLLASFTVRWLAVLAESKDKKTRWHRQVESDPKTYLARIFSQREGIFVARQEILYNMGDILTWLYDPQRQRQLLLQANQQWSDALDQLEAEARLSPVTQLWVMHARLRSAQLRAPSRPIDKVLTQRARDLVRRSLRAAKGPEERHALLSAASYILQELGDAATARELIKAELKDSHAPWYLHSMLSQLEEKLGNIEVAMQWSLRARVSAQGKATVVQWAAQDLLLRLRHPGHRENGGLQRSIEDFYQAVWVQSDGFSGRNRLRLDSVRNALSATLQDPAIRKTVLAEQNRCTEIDEDLRQKCRRHFDLLLRTLD